MSLISTEAFVINGFKYGETSKIVTFYSFDMGKFSAVVKGVRTTKSRHSGVYENMNLVHLFFNKKDNRSLQVISKAECINSFKNIKCDLDKINSAYQVLELVNKSTMEYDTHPEIFFLIKDILFLIEMMKISNELPLLLFTVKLANHLGIEPAVLNSDAEITANTAVSDGTFTIDKTLILSDEEYKLLQLLRNYNFELNDIVETNVYNMERLLKMYESFFVHGFHKPAILKSSKVKEELKKNL